MRSLVSSDTIQLITNASLVECSLNCLQEPACRAFDLSCVENSATCRLIKNVRHSACMNSNQIQHCAKVSLFITLSCNCMVKWVHKLLSFTHNYLFCNLLFNLQQEPFCKRFHINGSVYGTCHGTYVYANEMCGGFPYYQKLTLNRFILRAYDMRWRCTGSRPSSSCDIGYFSRSSNRDQVVGVWGGSAHVNCLEW